MRKCKHGKKCPIYYKHISPITLQRQVNVKVSGYTSEIYDYDFFSRIVKPIISFFSKSRLIFSVKAYCVRIANHITAFRLG